MKIVIITNIFPPRAIGGYELGCEDIANELFKKGNSVSVITSNIFLDEGTHDFKVSRILEMLPESPKSFEYKNIFFNIENLRIIEHFLDNERPELVIVFNLEGLGVLGLLYLLKMKNLPTIFYLMDNIFRGLPIPSEFFDRCRGYFGDFTDNSNFIYISMSDRLIFEIKQLTGFELVGYKKIPGWSINEAKTLSQNRYNKNTCVRLIFTSRIAPHKGTELLLDALHILANKGIANLHVDFYGDGEIYQFISSAKIKKVFNMISYKGSISKAEMLLRYHDYDALIFPTWAREPFGFVVSEAMTEGLVPLLTEGTGAAEYLTNGLNCIKFERDASAIASAIEQFISLPIEEREKLSQNCKILAESLFSFKNCYSQLNEYIEKFLHESKIDSKYVNSKCLPAIKYCFQKFL